MKQIFNSQSGFTLLELIIVVAMTILVGLVAVPFYSRFFNQNAVANATDQLTGELRKAQMYSIVGKRGGQWGVAYNSNNIILFQGNTFATRNTAFDETFSVGSNVSVSGFTELEFNRMTGTPSAAPNITISGGGNTKTVAISTLGVVSSISGGTSTGYLFKKLITIDHTKINGGTDLSNFPVLISMVDPNLKTVANGGFVQSANGFDIIFRNAAETVQLNHEIEKYVPSTGEIDMWVRLPTLSASSDTSMYIYYDNSAVTSSQENTTSVWDANYLSVWHLKEDPSGVAPQITDSTIGSNNGTTHNMVLGDSLTGKIDGALNFNGSNKLIDVGTGGSVKGATQYTISAWFTVTAFTTVNKMQLYSECTNVSGTTRLNFGLTQASPGQITLNGRSADADTLATFVTNSTTLSTGTWYYASAVFDSTSATNNMHLMLNGIDQTASFSKPAIANTTPGHVTEIGAHCAGASEFWNGKIDELRLSNTARTVGWNTTEYNNLNSPSTFYTVSSAIAGNF